MKAATERKRRHQFQAVAPVAIVANAILIIHQHMIHAEAIFQWNNDTSDSGVFDNQTLNAVGVNRFRSFDELTDLDFVFLGCLLMLGLELNNFVIKIFGGALAQTEGLSCVLVLTFIYIIIPNLFRPYRLHNNFVHFEWDRCNKAFYHSCQRGTP